MSSLSRSNAKEKVVTIHFVPLRCQVGFGGISSAQTSDTSDDESTYNGNPRQKDSSDRTIRPTQHKVVKKTVANHISSVDAARKCEKNPNGRNKRPLNVTRVVKTCKPDSVLGEGLVVSEQIRSPVSAESLSDSSCAGAAMDRANSPATEAIEEQRKKIYEKSRNVDSPEPRDVLLNEGSTEAGVSAVYKPSLMGIDSSFVPPELACFGLGLISWGHFAAALNAAIPRGKQEIRNQISRWNRDVFREHGFALSLSSMDPSLTFTVSKL
ncbi:hypothetical protein IW140_005949 [Coemansia sp. RSA 1813]|nr:hypothetical protein EV178_006509 [Coemansia sp. RSA 1646]KAJ1767541.1 hypothetical protein LPJ74_005321 [Coemansia sp. RSA 1843]KAJ2084969.1 hypothetical protein IW138_006530 [Coemansia sp. RSA 986]KAJ2210072.1 hypothetical protein EV179_006445 [Coemansia sp. RSA 487]KAJ2563887.1 hypothetical protein IW140_005949 [Coemansia sp. RSA 1813]